MLDIMFIPWNVYLGITFSCQLVFRDLFKQMRFVNYKEQKWSVTLVCWKELYIMDGQELVDQDWLGWNSADIRQFPGHFVYMKSWKGKLHGNSLRGKGCYGSFRLLTFLLFWGECMVVLQRLKAGGDGDVRGWDDWMTSPTQWIGVWANSGRWWRTGKPSVVQSMGLQRVRHDWVTEQQLYVLNCLILKPFFQTIFMSVITDLVPLPSL